MTNVTLNKLTIDNGYVTHEDVNSQDMKVFKTNYRISELDLTNEQLDQLSKIESISVCYLTGDEMIGQDIDWGTFLIDNPLALRVDTKILKELVTDILDQVY